MLPVPLNSSKITSSIFDDVSVSADATEEQVKEKAFNEEQIKKFTEGKEIRKVIYVKGKLLNVVVA